MKKNIYLLFVFFFMFQIFSESISNFIPCIPIQLPDEEETVEMYKIMDLLYNERASLKKSCSSRKFIKYYGVIDLDENTLIKSDFPKNKNKVYIVTIDNLDLPECKLAYIDNEEIINFYSERIYFKNRFLDIRCWLFYPKKNRVFLIKRNIKNKIIKLELQ